MASAILLTPASERDVSILLLIILILVIAAAGGFLGTLLEVAGWLLLVLIVLGAIVGFLVWRWVRGLLPSDRR